MGFESKISVFQESRSAPKSPNGILARFSGALRDHTEVSASAGTIQVFMNFDEASGISLHNLCLSWLGFANVGYTTHTLRSVKEFNESLEYVVECNPAFACFTSSILRFTRFIHKIPTVGRATT